jgi:CBS domain-containing protein
MSHYEKARAIGVFIPEGGVAAIKPRDLDSAIQTAEVFGANMGLDLATRDAVARVLTEMRARKAGLAGGQVVAPAPPAAAPVVRQVAAPAPVARPASRFDAEAMHEDLDGLVSWLRAPTTRTDFHFSDASNMAFIEAGRIAAAARTAYRSGDVGGMIQHLAVAASILRRTFGPISQSHGARERAHAEAAITDVVRILSRVGGNLDMARCAAPEALLHEALRAMSAAIAHGVVVDDNLVRAALAEIGRHPLAARPVGRHHGDLQAVLEVILNHELSGGNISRLADLGAPVSSLVTARERVTHALAVLDALAGGPVQYTDEQIDEVLTRVYKDVPGGRNVRTVDDAINDAKESIRILLDNEDFTGMNTAYLRLEDIAVFLNGALEAHGQRDDFTAKDTLEAIRDEKLSPEARRAFDALERRSPHARTRIGWVAENVDEAIGLLEEADRRHTERTEARARATPLPPTVRETPEEIRAAEARSAAVGRDAFLGMFNAALDGRLPRKNPGTPPNPGGFKCQSFKVPLDQHIECACCNAPLPAGKRAYAVVHGKDAAGNDIGEGVCSLGCATEFVRNQTGQ